MRNYLINYIRVPSIAGQYGPAIHSYLDQLTQVRDISSEEISRKLSHESSSSKRQRTDSPTSSTENGVISYASLYALVDTKIPLRNFDVKSLPLDVVTEIALTGMAKNSPQTIELASRAVQTRYSKLYPAPDIIKIEDDGTLEKLFVPPKPATLPVIDSPYADDDDDNYEPDDYEPPDVVRSPPFSPNPPSQPTPTTHTSMKYEAQEDEDDDDYNPEALIDQFQPVLANKSANTQQDDEYLNEFRDYSPEADALALATREPMTDEERLATFQECIERLFVAGEDIERSIFEIDGLAKGAKDIQELNSVGLRGDVWVVLLARLSTRGITALQTSNMTESQIQQVSETMAQFIREKLFAYVTANFRERVEVAIMWLSEEWYNEKMKARKALESEPNTEGHQSVTEGSAYMTWTSKIIDSVIPFLDVKDKVFLRFLSDLPELTNNMLYKLRILLSDPDRQKLGRFALQYVAFLFL